MHLLLDAEIERQLKKHELKKAVRDLTGKMGIGMTAIGPVVVEEFAGYDYGSSAVQMLAESHISVHYMKNVVWIDIFSCKDFDMTKAVDFCKKRFLITRVTNLQMLRRGEIL